MAERPASTPLPPPAVLVFDACNIGVVLRAVLFVQTVVATASLYAATAPGQWLRAVALLTAGTLPGTLVWLIAACALKLPLQRMHAPMQYALGVLLGAAAGLLACALLRLSGLTAAAAWLASAASGALLAALLVTGLIMRARARTPAQTQARLAELQSRIRPHFLFNTLNSAIALLRAEPDKAEALLEDLSDLFRSALAERPAATLGEEIQLARHYLEIEQVRFGTQRLRVHWQLQPHANAALLPPLLLQPLVENAVRHGVEPCADGGTVQIRTEVRNRQALVTIWNSLPVAVPATAPTHGHGIALNNVRARLALLHDLQASLRVRTIGRQFVVRISLPLPRVRRLLRQPKR